MKSDANKGISLIEYDTFLKKVKQVNWTDGRWLKFFYDGSGKLLKRENSLGDYWEYVGGTGGVPLIFKNGQPYQLTTPEDRAVFESNAWNYEFEYRDVWGNLRVAFKADGSQLVKTQSSDYDALGFEYNKTEQAQTNKFKYQKQERIDDFNLGIDMFKFRPSDYQIGRFWQIDPLAEQYVYNSPYALQENKFGLGIELEGAELQEFLEWSEKAAKSAWKSFVNTIPEGLKIEQNYSIGPQIGFEVQTPATSMQAELKLASFDIAQRKLEKKNGNLVETSTLGYTQKTNTYGADGKNSSTTKELDGANVENSFGLSLGVGPLSLSQELGQRQDIKICAGCQGSSNTRQFSKTSTGLYFGTLEKTTEKKYGELLKNQPPVELNLYKLEIRFGIGVEIKVGF